jgi:hypothetical protein
MKTDYEKNNLRQILVICILTAAAAVLCTFYCCVMINNLKHDSFSEFYEFPNVNFSFSKNKRCFSTKHNKMFADNQICIKNANDIDLCLHFGEQIAFTGANHNNKTPCIPSNRQTFFCKINNKIQIAEDIPKAQNPNIELTTDNLPQHIAFCNPEGKRGIIHVKEITKTNCVCDILLEK